LRLKAMINKVSEQADTNRPTEQSTEIGS
jgi:hypothetical protein